MSVDLNKIMEDVKSQKPLGVNMEGQVQEDNPRNDGTQEGNNKGYTTLEPQRFFKTKGGLNAQNTI